MPRESQFGRKWICFADRQCCQFSCSNSVLQMLLNSLTSSSSDASMPTSISLLLWKQAKWHLSGHHLAFMWAVSHCLTYGKSVVSCTVLSVFSHSVLKFCKCPVVAVAFISNFQSLELYPIFLCTVYRLVAVAYGCVFFCPKWVWDCFSCHFWRIYTQFCCNHLAGTGILKNYELHLLPVLVHWNS